MANGIIKFTFLDYDGERSSATMQTGAVTAVSLPGLLAEVGTIRAAIQDMIRGTIQGESLKVFDTTLSNARPADAEAGRESKWLVRYEDTLPFFDDPVNAIPNEGFGKVFTFTIPTAMFQGHLLANSDEADPANADVIALTAALEATLRSPYGGTISVLGYTRVGRNL